MTDFRTRQHQLEALAKAGAKNSRPPVRTSRAESGSRGTLYLYGPIMRYSFFEDAVSSKNVIRALKDLDVDELDVHINSPGGDVIEGIAILNSLRNHRSAITVHVDGLAASAASYVALAGDEIVMGQGAEIMIHDAWMFTMGNEEELRDDAAWIGKQSQNIATLYSRRAGGTPDEWRARMKAETWYTDEEAVAAGLADRVSGLDDDDTDPGDVEIPGEELPDGADAWDLSIYTYAGRAHAPAPPAASAAAHRPPAASAGGSHPNPEGAKLVDLNDEQIATLRKQVGFPEDADAATITAAVVEALEEKADPASNSVPEGHVAVSKAEWEEMRGDAQRGAAAAKRLHETERESALDKYADRYLPANRESWRDEYDRNPKATVEALEKRPVVIPLDELGHSVDADTPEAASLDEIRNDTAYKNWRM